MYQTTVPVLGNPGDKCNNVLTKHRCGIKYPLI